jgi:hypothetical protein
MPRYVFDGYLLSFTKTDHYLRSTQYDHKTLIIHDACIKTCNPVRSYHPSCSLPMFIRNEKDHVLNKPGKNADSAQEPSANTTPFAMH